MESLPIQCFALKEFVKFTRPNCRKRLPSFRGEISDLQARLTVFHFHLHPIANKFLRSQFSKASVVLSQCRLKLPENIFDFRIRCDRYPSTEISNSVVQTAQRHFYEVVALVCIATAKGGADHAAHRQLTGLGVGTVKRELRVLRRVLRLGAGWS